MSRPEARDGRTDTETETERDTHRDTETKEQEDRSVWPERLPAEFYEALEQCNRGEYFACHETLEALWISEKGPVRELYQGVLQIAVGCFHLTVRKNWVGAVNKLREGRLRLERAGIERAGIHSQSASDPFASPRTCGFYGVDWPALLGAAERLENSLRAAGRERVEDYDRTLLPRIVYAPGKSMHHHE